MDIDNDNDMLFDFTTMASLSDEWREVSDTVREVGMSKATLVLQKTRIYQRAIFFALLNPQPNGACFAGMEIDGHFDLSQYSGFEIKLRSQSSNMNKWKILLKNPGASSRYDTYQQQFEVIF